MRIALLADTHGFLDPRIAQDMAGMDRIVHAGDVGAGIAPALAEIVPNPVIVTGNNDPAEAGWPEAETLDLPGGQLAIMHGHQWPARTRHRRLAACFADARAVVLGHSHRRVLDQDTTPWIINPGAAGTTRAYGGPSWVALIAEPDAWHATAHIYTPRSASRSRRR